MGIRLDYENYKPSSTNYDDRFVDGDISSVSFEFSKSNKDIAQKLSTMGAYICPKTNVYKLLVTTSNIGIVRQFIIDNNFLVKNSKTSQLLRGLMKQKKVLNSH